VNNLTFSLLAEFWAFLRVRKKWWLAPHCYHARTAQCLDFLHAGFRRSALHLYDFLMVRSSSAAR